MPEYKDEYDDVITLGVDGNCVYALYGTDISTGEVEFIEIVRFDLKRWSPKWIKFVQTKAIEAGRKLAKRLNVPCRFSFDDNISPGESSV